ncbi:MAG: phosphate acyltransferase [Legionellales bacterium RIFCSPHIGHO2_12_FULL_35_11]|nr:MAG: phosphate acyltransferase [Legionellales bacterium RIFCSPHIGHO2_12_FULL_35_11]
MGGDHGLSVVIPASLRAVRNNPALHLILVGDEVKILAHLKKHGLTDLSNSQLEIKHASEIVEMDELPSHALRNKKDSSMRVAINLVKDEIAAACVSAGNTGAMMATARFVLKTLPGIDRPAIIAELPTAKGQTRVIDLGANVDSCAEHLFQFAVMGSALIKAIENRQPKVAVLNIGVEEIKGNDQVKRTAHMLSECELIDYVGYVEGDQFYSGEVDLVVCDGFVGNVALKASEGLASLMINVLKESFTQNWWSKISGIIAKPALAHLKNRMDPARYNGASLLGLNGIVVKSHGGANSIAFQYAIEQAMLQVKSNVVDLLRDQITDFVERGILL